MNAPEVSSKRLPMSSTAKRFFKAINCSVPAPFLETNEADAVQLSQDFELSQGNGSFVMGVFGIALPSDANLKAWDCFQFALPLFDQSGIRMEVWDDSGNVAKVCPHDAWHA